VYNHIHHLVFAPGKTRGRPRGSKKLADFKAQILSSLELQPDISVNRLLRDLQNQGYSGGLSILRDFCRSLKQDNAIPFETPSQSKSAYPELKATHLADSEYGNQLNSFIPSNFELVANAPFPKMDN
jgi:hypothetical protein